MPRVQQIVIGAAALTFLVALLTIFLHSTPSTQTQSTGKIVIQSHEQVQIEYQTSSAAKEDTTTVTAQPWLEDLGFKSPGEEHVPKHVSLAIDKLYRELKHNRSIVNDQVTTADPIIPNVFHYVRFNQSNMRFYEMLSIKSALKIGGAEKVLIHTNMNPEGKFWDMIKDESRLKVVHRDPPTSIFGRPFGWVQHASDLARIQILREYGGIYLDNDCIVVNEFERVRKHHCVVSKASDERHMGNMVLMGTKDCVFLRLYEELYKLHYDRDAWYYNGGELPQYAVLDKYPGVAYYSDEGVQQGIMFWLWKLNQSIEDVQKYWRIIHLFYGHKHYTYNDTVEYDDQNIKTIENTFTRIARWIMYDHPDPMKE